MLVLICKLILERFFVIKIVGVKDMSTEFECIDRKSRGRNGESKRFSGLKCDDDSECRPRVSINGNKRGPSDVE